MAALAAILLLSLPAIVPRSPRQPSTPPAVRARGIGELRLAHRFPLGDLLYSADPSGRGMLMFPMGRGMLMLSGADGDEIAPGRFRLMVDVLQVSTMAKARGTCDLALSPDRRVYRSVSCSGRVLANGERFSVAWTGAGSPAEPVR